MVMDVNWLLTLCSSVNSVVKFSVHPPHNALLEPGDVEIDQQPHTLAAELEIRDELRLVNRFDHFDRLQLQNHLVFDQNVDPVARVDSDSIVDYWQLDLTLGFEAALVQFIEQTNFIGSLEESRPQTRMNLHGGGDDLGGELSGRFDGCGFHGGV